MKTEFFDFGKSISELDLIHHTKTKNYVYLHYSVLVTVKIKKKKKNDMFFFVHN